MAEGKFTVAHGVGMGSGAVYSAYADKCRASPLGEGGYADPVLNSEEEVTTSETSCVETGYALVECASLGFGSANPHCVTAKVDNCSLENSKLKDTIECVSVDSRIDRCCVPLSPRATTGCPGGNSVSNSGIPGGAPTVGGTALCPSEPPKVLGPCVVPEDKGCPKEHAYDTLAHSTAYDNLGSSGLGVYPC